MSDETTTEVVNVALAKLLEERQLAAVPEQILRAAEGGRSVPDVIVDFRDLRLAIEGEFADTPHARNKALTKAIARVEQGIAHIGVAVVYPERLYAQSFPQLAEALASSQLTFVVATALPEAPSVAHGSMDDLGEALRRACEQLLDQPPLEAAVAVLEAGIGQFIAGLGGQPATAQRFAEVLAMTDAAEKPDGRQLLAILRIAGLVIANALISQETLAARDPRALGTSQLALLTQAYDRVAQEPLTPFPELDTGPPRKALDDAVAGALGLAGACAAARDACPRAHRVSRRAAAGATGRTTPPVSAQT